MVGRVPHNPRRKSPDLGNLEQAMEFAINAPEIHNAASNEFLTFREM
jgi:hypothetical protein